MFCGKHLDGIGKECLESNKYTYKYKDMVEIPPLIMLDDLITISECGPKTAMVHSYVKFQTLSKKLQFGNDKCKFLHCRLPGDDTHKKLLLSCRPKEQIRIVNYFTAGHLEIIKS